MFCTHAKNIACIETDRGRDIHRQRQTETDTDRDRHRQRQTQTETDRERQTETDRERQTETDCSIAWVMSWPSRLDYCSLTLPPCN